MRRGSSFVPAPFRIAVNTLFYDNECSFHTSFSFLAPFISCVNGFTARMPRVDVPSVKFCCASMVSHLPAPFPFFVLAPTLPLIIFSFSEVSDIADSSIVMGLSAASSLLVVESCCYWEIFKHEACAWRPLSPFMLAPFCRSRYFPSNLVVLIMLSSYFIDVPLRHCTDSSLLVKCHVHFLYMYKPAHVIAFEDFGFCVGPSQYSPIRIWRI